ncbi:MAG: hypothetical protein JW894_10060 [Bacteroidales bacterium]|nr:hypothetical protein [Bacteroidales bacterium]
MKNNKHKYSYTFTGLLLGFYLAVFTTNSFPQSPDLRFRHISTREGLSNSSVTCIYQDSYGLMWFGTSSGLNKYDGYKCSVYFEDDSDSSSISSNVIVDIIEDSSGNIWISTGYGLNKYLRDKDMFIRYVYSEYDTNSIENSLAQKLLIDHTGQLWVPTRFGGLNLFINEENRFLKYQHDSSNNNSISSNDLMSITEDSDKNIWVGSWDGKVDRFNRETGKFEHIEIINPSTKLRITESIRFIFEDENKNIWVATHGAGLFKLTPALNGEFEINNYIHNPKDKSTLNGNFVLCGSEGSANGFWLGLENDGLNFFNIETEKVTRYNANKYDPEGLSGNSIWSVYKDKSNNLWVGTFFRGINISIKSGGFFRHYKNNAFDDLSLSDNIISSFCEDELGNIWIGTDGGGLDYFDRAKNTFKHYNTSNSNITSDAVLSVFFDSKDQLWVGTWAGGLLRFDRNNGSFRHYSEESGLKSNNIICIYEDREGTVWVGTFWDDPGGFACYDRNNDHFVTYNAENSDLSHNTIYAILEDESGYIWLGTHRGLDRFDKKTKEITFFMYNEEDPDVGEGVIRSMVLSHDSVLWLATSNGLLRFDREKEIYDRRGINEELAYSSMQGLEEDNLGNLWASTDNGIARFNPETGEFKRYTVADGLQGNEFFRCSHYKASNGEIYFGGPNGFNVFNPTLITEDTIKPEILLTDFKIFNRSVEIGSSDSPLKKHINVADKIELSYKHSVFSFEFAALNFNAPELVNYAYMMEGFEKDWNYVGQLRTATYTNLDPGRYKFRVMVPYANGICNEEGISIDIVITPPFWETIWFRIIVIISIIAIILSIFYWRVNEIRQQNIKLEKEVKKRTQKINQKNQLLLAQSDELLETNTLLEERQQQIEEQSEELRVQRDELFEVNSVKDKLFSIVAHDLKNPFNTLCGFTELLQEKYDKYNEEKRKQMINFIKESSDQIYELLENLLTWSRSQRGVIQYNPVKTNLTDLISYNINLVSNQASNKQISIQLKDNNLTPQINLDPDLINTVMRNLLTNAIKFSERGGSILVSLTENKNKYIVSVQDSGIGISQENLNKLFKKNMHFTTSGTDNEKGTGLGLIMCQDFIEKHKGEIWVESTEGKGSTFYFSLPK